MNLKVWLRDMELLNYMIIGNTKPFIIITLKKEVKKEMDIIEKTIQDCVINDILEVCKEDMKSKQKNKCPEKIIIQLTRWLFEHEKL